MAPLSFVLDGVLDSNADQSATYTAIGASAVEDLLRGEGSSILAFGPVGSGKTYTLFGPTDLLSNTMSEAWMQWGLLPRASHHLFSRASAVGGVEGLLGPGSSVSCTFLEVCDECIHDLLGKGRDLRLRETASEGVHVPELTVRLVEWEEDVMRALLIGLSNRSSTAGTSSTAHTIFTLTVSKRLANGSVQHSRLQFVELAAAGTPRPGSSAATGRAASQPANQGLTALNLCINALAESTSLAGKVPSLGEPNPQGVPYRDSKLTWLLRDALGGNAVAAGTNTNAIFIALCGAEPGRLPLTINSLRFAHRCRQARVWVAEPPASEMLYLMDESVTTPEREQAGDAHLLATPDVQGWPSGGSSHASATPFSQSTPHTAAAAGTSSSSPPHAASPPSAPSPPPAPHLGPHLGPSSDSESSDEGEPADTDTAEVFYQHAQEALAPSTRASASRRSRPSPRATYQPPYQPTYQPSPAQPAPSPPLVPHSGSGGGGVAAAASHSLISVDLAKLSERSAEAAALRQRLAEVQLQVAADEEAKAASPITNTDGFEQLRSAQAHMLLLEARLAELSQSPDNTTSLAATSLAATSLAATSLAATLAMWA